MNPADRWAIRGIKNLMVDILTTNKNSLENMKIRDVGTHYFIQVSTKIPKDDVKNEVSTESKGDCSTDDNSPNSSEKKDL